MWLINIYIHICSSINDHHPALASKIKEEDDTTREQEKARDEEGGATGVEEEQNPNKQEAIREMAQELVVKVNRYNAFPPL